MSQLPQALKALDGGSGVTEFDVLYLLQEKIATFWSLFQFWSGITFAYIAVSHFAASRLNSWIILCLSLVYSSMFLHVLQLMARNHASIDGLVLDLEYMAASVEQVSNATRAQLESSESMSVIPAIIAIFGSFAGALIYLPYKRYWEKGGGN